MLPRLMLCLVFFLSGCSSVPRQSSYPCCSQKEMLATDDWNAFAGEVVANFFPEIPCSPVSPLDRIVVEDSDRSPFGRAFRTFLICQLGSRAAQTSAPSAEDLRITWSVQLVEYPYREVIITAYLTQAGNIKRNLTGSFYINDADHWQYWDQPDVYIAGPPLIPVSYTVVNR